MTSLDMLPKQNWKVGSENLYNSISIVQTERINKEELSILIIEDSLKYSKII